MGRLQRKAYEAVPSIGRPPLLLLVDGNLPQQRHRLTVPVQDEGMVGRHHRVVTLPDSLQAGVHMPCHNSLLAFGNTNLFCLWCLPVSSAYLVNRSPPPV